MRYFVTMDDQEFSLSVPAAGRAERTALQPAKPDQPLYQVELLSHAGTDRPALVLVDGRVFRVRTASHRGDGRAGGAGKSSSVRAHATINGRSLTYSIETELERRARPSRQTAVSSTARVTAPMPGRVVKVTVRVGDTVAPGAGLVSIEAMKMENEVQAPCAGRVSRIAVEAGATVEADQELLVIEPLA